MNALIPKVLTDTRGLAAAHPPSTTVNPILRRPGEIVQHEESIELNGATMRIRVIVRANALAATWSCNCRQSGIRAGLPSVEVAQAFAYALAGQHAVECHGR
ncbi:MAG: hypothetical protein IT428_18055 [Planctomycetaceae bacterium]|nr:hypothetical protein [Planctomycetaceae bacterium]